MVNPNACLANTNQELLPRNVELADVVHRFGAEYQSQYEQAMLPSHKRALTDIEACCTQQLGGRLYQCDDCTESFWVYHSCRNRACPKFSSFHGRVARGSMPPIRPMPSTSPQAATRACSAGVLGAS